MPHLLSLQSPGLRYSKTGKATVYYLQAWPGSFQILGVMFLCCLVTSTLGLEGLKVVTTCGSLEMVDKHIIMMSYVLQNE